MYKTVNEVMTAICNRIRAYAVSYRDKKITLSEMPVCIDEVYVEGQENGYQLGQNNRNGEIYEKLSETVQLAKDYADGGTGESGHSVETQIDFINQNIPNVYNTGIMNGEGAIREEFDRTMSRIDSTLKNTVSITNEHLESSDMPVTPWEKIAYLDENIPEVYKTGRTAGHAEGETAGRAAERSEFWETYQEGGGTKSYVQAFANSGWTDAVYDPIYPLKGTQFLRCYSYSKITDTKVPIIVDTDNENVLASAFSGVTTLKNITELSVRASNTFSSTFNGCTALENIRFSGVIGQNIDLKDSPLNRESIESIVTALSENASGKTLTLNKSAVNTAFGINVDDESTFPAGSEFYKLRHSKDNWAFSYMNA